MASILTPEDFQLEVSIPDRGKEPVKTELQAYINKYESELLSALLGLELYGILTGTDLTPLQTALKAQAGEAAKYYVYYMWRKFHVTSYGGAVESVANVDNSTAVSPVDKMVWAWNEMVRCNWLIVKSNTLTVQLPNRYDCFFQRTNSFGL